MSSNPVIIIPIILILCCSSLCAIYIALLPETVPVLGDQVRDPTRGGQTRTYTTWSAGAIGCCSCCIVLILLLLVILPMLTAPKGTVTVPSATTVPIKV